MPLICKRLGISTIELPFDFDEMDFDYEAVNQIIKENSIQGILVCPSDLLWQPHLERIQLPADCILIYDATQTLGLMVHQNNENPLDKFSDADNFILMGATHKTIPGPTCGLIMTKNLKLAERFDTKINPDYLRNVQFHHILSLSLVLMELEAFGDSYGKAIINNANQLGKHLEDNGFSVIKRSPNRYTSTHQIFLPMPVEQMNVFMNRCRNLGIALNARYKRLYQGSGIRIGVQEVTRYGWGVEEMNEIASILALLQYNKIDTNTVNARISTLVSHRQIHYTFDAMTQERINNVLHNG